MKLKMSFRSIESMLPVSKGPQKTCQLFIYIPPKYSPKTFINSYVLKDWWVWKRFQRCKSYEHRTFYDCDYEMRRIFFGAILLRSFSNIRSSPISFTHLCSYSWNGIAVRKREKNKARRARDLYFIQLTKNQLFWRSVTLSVTKTRNSRFTADINLTLL